ncbi:hypothetical protein BJ165DRAFT_1530761 [Panaeolus papilionaceus]|nr:hypothetical protein BJ165DRAFT_1530761 [Panaeolus papilionaceus]
MCHGTIFLVPSFTLDKETAVLKNLTMARRLAELALCVRTQNITVVPVVQPETFGRASFPGGSFYYTCGAFPTTTLPYYTSPEPSPPTSYPNPHGFVTIRRGLLGQVVDPLPWSLVFVDDVAWVLHRTTGLLPAMTIRRINGPERRWRAPSFEKV